MAAQGFALALAILAAAAASVRAQDSVPLWPTNVTSINVCTSEYTPMVYCVDREPSGYSGYEIELFRKVALILGWSESQMQWSCLAWDDMIAGLANGTCDIAVAGVQINAAILEAGLVLTRPTYRNGLKILVTTSQKTSGIWAFWDAFTWQLWLAAVLTAAAVSVIVWAIDLYQNAPPPPDPAALEVTKDEDAHAAAVASRDTFLSRYFWEAVTRPMMTRDQIALTFAGNLIVAVYSFLVLIVFILYLGNTAASLTTLRLDTGSISSLADLRGKAVGTWTDYADDTLRYGITATSFPWDTAADEDAMFSALATGEVKALVLDGTLLDYKSATDCAFSTVGEAFNPYDQTTAFPKGFEAPELLTAYNDALVSLQSNGDVQNLVDTYVNAASGLCDELSTSRVAFHQVSGLWILLAGCIGFAGVLLALQVAHAKWVAPRLRASP